MIYLIKFFGKNNDWTTLRFNNRDDAMTVYQNLLEQGYAVKFEQDIEVL